MSEKIKINKIEIKIGEIEVGLTLEEVKELKAVLSEILNPPLCQPQYQWQLGGDWDEDKSRTVTSFDTSIGPVTLKY